MATFDVRNEGTEEITEIVFANAHGAILTDQLVAYKLDRGFGSYNLIRIADRDDHDRVLIESKQHALNLIKALNKAIELGWVK